MLRAARKALLGGGSQQPALCTSTGNPSSLASGGVWRWLCRQEDPSSPSDEVIRWSFFRPEAAAELRHDFRTEEVPQTSDSPGDWDGDATCSAPAALPPQVLAPWTARCLFLRCDSSLRAAPGSFLEDSILGSSSVRHCGFPQPSSQAQQPLHPSYGGSMLGTGVRPEARRACAARLPCSHLKSISVYEARSPCTSRWRAYSTFSHYVPPRHPGASSPCPLTAMPGPKAFMTDSASLSARLSGVDASVSASQEPETPSAAQAKRRTRPYLAATAAEAPGEKGQYAVLLDRRELLTPAKKPVRIPSLPLALAVAAEWEWQEGLRLRPYTMPLMKLTATTLDQIPREREKVISSLVDFFHTDQVLLRHPEPKPEPEPEPEPETSTSPGGMQSLWASPSEGIKGASFLQHQRQLWERQNELWDPVLDDLKSEFHIEAVPTSAYIPPPQPTAAVINLEMALETLDAWHLAAVDSLANAARSVSIGLLLSKGLIDVDTAVAAARLEEDFQIAAAGFVEGGHDIDLADLRVKLLAPTVFLRLLRFGSTN